MELDIESVAGGGAGVGRADGRVWFVRGALRGERVDAVPVRRRAGIVEAETRLVLEASPDREPHPCPVAQLCGGCSLAHVRRESAAAVLRQATSGGLRHADPSLSEAVSQARVIVSPWRSRLRARLHWDPDTGRLGFHAPRSHETVSAEPCRVISERLASTIDGLQRALLDSAAARGDVDWLEDLEGRRAVAGWRGPGGPPQTAVAGLDGWWSLTDAGRGWGERKVTMRLPVPLDVPIGAFFQANRLLVPRLFARVAELVARHGWRRVVDLYGGVGFLAAASRRGGASEITVVESQRSAAMAARENLPEAEIHACSAEEFLASNPGRDPDLVIVDAPRVGMSGTARSGLATLAPPAVLFLSCDVSRFGRDAGALLEAGYAVELLELWDFFAGSHHVEILALFRR